jgi:hypothetical protein
MEGKSMNWRILFLVVVAVLLIAATILFFKLSLHQKVTIVTDEVAVEGLKLTPVEALKIATPHLEAHGTYDWKKNHPLKTYVACVRS